MTRPTCSEPRALLDEVAAGSALALRLTKAAVDAPAGAHPQFDLASQAISGGG